MDSVLINNLKERIDPKDILYFLGDLTFKEKVAQEFFEIFEDNEMYYIIGTPANTSYNHKLISWDFHINIL